MQFSSNFKQALQDYIFLLEKKYPQKTIHKMVSTHYSLDHFERSVLFRGVTTKEKKDSRQKKIIQIEHLHNGTLHLDLFNVLFTIAAYLRGFPVYFAIDGFMRDASESHGNGEWSLHLEKSLELLIGYLSQFKINKSIYYIDNPLENGKGIIDKLDANIELLKNEIEIIADPSPDHLILEAKEGIIATSDSSIIDKSILPVLDLPATVLYFHFEPKIISLEKF